MATEIQFCYQNLTTIPALNNNYIIAETEEKTKDVTYSCTLCKITATSHKVLQRHYDGRKHRMRMEREGKTFVCELCEITANSQKQLDNHLKSARHRCNIEKRDSYHCLKTVSHKGSYIILFFIACMFINFLLLFKMFL